MFFIAGNSSSDYDTPAFGSFGASDGGRNQLGYMETHPENQLGYMETHPENTRQDNGYLEVFDPASLSKA